MVRPISASGLRAVCPLCAHARPLTYAWFCKMSAGPPMARPRSAHDAPLVNQRHAHGFADGRLMLCQVCMLVVSQRVVAFIRQTDWTDLCASHWTDHGFGRHMGRPFDKQLARPLDRPNTGRRVGRLVGRPDHWACFCVANKQANVSTSQSSNGFYGFASSLLQGPPLAFIGQT